jgi:hypothetical protein
MVRFYSSINADDKMLVVQISCDNGFHGLPTKNRCRTSSEGRMSRQRSRPFKSKLILVRNWLYLAERYDFVAFCCRNATR